MDTQENTGDAPPFGYTPDGSPRKSGYFAIIGDSPTCGPADHDTALAYLHKIDTALARGGWTPYEQNRLQKLRKKWGRRAHGKDPRFELVGTRDGRLPARIEYELRPKQRRAKQDEERATKRAGAGVPDQRRNPERRWQNLDLPPGKATGAAVAPESEADVWDPEAGHVPLPTIPSARQYLIPGQDTKGHAHRVYARVMPAHYRAMCALERSKVFGFRTLGDVTRWCIDFGIRELNARANVPQAMSAMAQVDAIREVLLDEQYYLEFPVLFEQMTQTINRHLSAGAEKEAIRLIAIVRHQIEQMGEQYWREKYMAELMRHYGSYLDGSRTAATDFGDSGNE